MLSINERTMTCELLIDKLYTENNLYDADVILMQYIKVSSLKSLAID